jgi:hypothetical protein
MSTFSIPTGWLLLLYSLPAKKTSGRVKLWRKLKKTGAHALKTSGYVLPDEPAHFEQFQWLAQQVRDDGGDANLARVTAIEGMTNDDLVRLFNEARAEDYAALTTPLNDLITANRNAVGEGFLDALKKLRRQYDEVRSIDFFGCPSGQDAEMLLQRAARLTEPRAKGRGKLDAKQFHGRTWLTRPHPEIDRVGSAWLIRKYIDPRAKFVFGANPASSSDAIPYDMLDVEFTHHGEACTFETLLKRFAITDPVALRMGQMIHDADLQDGKFQRPECVGLDRLFKGWARLGLSSEEILERGLGCFDAFYASFPHGKGRFP